MKKKSLLSRLISSLPGTQPEPSIPYVAQAGKPDLRLVFFIVDWHQDNIISKVFEEEKVRFYFVAKGKGTASSEILDLLGLGASDKAVIICLEQVVGVPVLIKEAQKKLKVKFHSPGTGIAFTVPLSAVNDPILLVFKQSILKSEKIAAERGSVQSRGEEKNMANEFSHDVIVSIVNHGYSDELMETARKAGATGGTVLNARGQAHAGAVKFFGVSVQDEKEMILILTSHEKKAAIMRAICESHGLNSNAQGIVFALPVDNVVGMGFES